MTSVDPTPASGMEAKDIADALERMLHSQRISANVQIAPNLVAAIITTLRSAETSAAFPWPEYDTDIPDAFDAYSKEESKGITPMGFSVTERMSATFRWHEAWERVGQAIAARTPRPAPVELDERARADLVERLSELADLMDDVYAGKYTPDSFTTQPARAIIAALSTVPAGEVEMQLRAALEPFAELAENFVGENEDDDDLYQPPRYHRQKHVTVRHLRGAVKALTLPASNAASDAVEREYQIDCPNCGGEGTLEHPHLGGMPSYAAECPPDAVVVDCEECQGTGQKWTDDPCTLLECPPGLFRHEDTLGFKSEYYSAPNKPDAYCVESGEYFWGGTSDVNVRANLLVQPVAALNRRTDAGGAK